MRKLIQLFLCSLIAVALSGAPNPDDYVRLLIPVHAPGTSERLPLPGTGGSQWHTTLWAFNANDFFVEVDNSPHRECAFTCPGPALPARTTVPMEGNIFIRLGGTFLYVHRDGFENVHFSARGYETSRDPRDAGFTIPIISRDEVEPGSVSEILDVPSTGPDRRTLLRIYDLEARNIVVRLRFVSREDVLLHETTIGLDGPGDDEGFPPAPSLAFLQLEDLPLPAALDGFRIEMEPVDPDSRVWGFLTITSNETHRVSLLMPQP